MYLNAQKKVGNYWEWKLFSVEGQAVKTAFACDTEEGWYEIWVLDPNHKPVEGGKRYRFLVDSVKREILTARIVAPFYIKNRDTGEIIHSQAKES